MSSMKTQVLYKSRTGNTEMLAKTIFEAIPGNSKDYLGSLEGKKIALFGTCGMGNSPEYYKKLEDNIKVFIEDDNEYLGAYICQGKMPISVRQKYMGMKNEKNARQVNAMIQNFDMAMLHPDKEDLQNARVFVKEVFEKIKREA